MDVGTAERRVWDELGLAPVEHRLELGHIGTTVRVQEVGAGPPAVFIHGASVSGTSWADLVAALPDVRCLLVDRPGCADSGPLPGSVDLSRVLAMADYLIVDVLDALDLPSAAVVATSRGALDALRGTVAHPDRVDRLLLLGWCMGAPRSVAPSWLRMGALPGAARLATAMPVTRGSVRASLRRFGLRRALEEGRFSDAALDWLVALYRDTDTLANELGSSRALLRIRAGWRDEVTVDPDVLGGIAAPTRIVWGTDDPFGTPNVARHLSEAIPGADVHVVANAGHAPWLDEPETCVELARSFLGRSPG